MKAKIKLLLIEDNPGDVQLCRELLKNSNSVSWELDTASTLEGGKELAAEGFFDLIVLDLNLPDSKGLETFRDLFSSGNDIPVVILSGSDDQALALEAVQLGAQDYLLKDQLTSQLAARSFQYAVERSQLSRQLAALSITDDLSGLMNRRGFFSLAEQQIKLARRLRKPMALFFLDIDDLKAINDRFGHIIGDRVIKAAAQVLEHTFRESDLTARLGGDEFAVLALDSEAAHQTIIHQRLLENLEKIQAETDLPCEFSISLGAAYWNGSDTLDLELLLQEADRSLYQKKGEKDPLPLKVPGKPPIQIGRPLGGLDSLKLLLVEDNPGDARLVEEFLADSEIEIQITHVDRLSKVAEVLGREDFSVVLLDLSLPDSQGLETIQSVRQLYPQIPLVVFTGADDTKTALAAIQAGAQEYLVKGQFDEVILERALHYAVERQALYRQNQAFLKEIKHSERNLQSVFDQVNLGIFRAELDGSLIFANRELVAQLGYESLEEVAGMNILTDHLKLDDGSISALKDGEVELSGEIRTLYNRDNEPTIIRIGLTQTLMEGKYIFTGTVEDISLQLESERQLKLQVTALNAAANAIIITDRDGLVIWSNQAFTDLTGYAPEEINGQSPRILNSGEQDADFYDSMWRTITSGRVWQGELVNRRKNGTTYPERMTITPLRNESGMITHYIAIKEDNTAFLRNQNMLHRRLAEVTAFHQVATAGIEETDEDQLISRVTEIIGKLIYTDHFGVLLLSEDGSELVVHPSFMGIPDECLKMTFSFQDGVVGRTARSREVILVKDVSLVPDFISITPDVQSELAVPLIADGELIGVINAESRLKNRFSEDDARLLETVSNQLGIALSQLRANQQERVQREKAEALADIALALNSSLEIDQVLDQILSKIALLVPYKTASLFLCADGQAKVMRHRGYQELGAVKWVERLSFKLEDTGYPIIDRMITTGEPQLVVDTNLDPDWNHFTETTWIRSYLGIPIRMNGHVRAFINLNHDTPGAFSNSQIELLVALSHQIATALENANLYRLQQQQLNFLESQRMIDNAITGSLDLDVTLKVIITELMSQLAVDAVNILTYDSEAFQLQSSTQRGFTPSPAPVDPHYQVEGLAGWIISNQTSLAVPDLNDPPVPLSRGDEYQREGFVSYHGIPLLAKGKIVGVMELFFRKKVEISPEWMRYAETVSAQTAIAIDNFHLFSSLQNVNLELSLAYDTTLEGWAGALELRDHETEGHSRRVVDLTMDLVKAMNVPADSWIHIRRGALLHDIGKMGVPDTILQKPGKLTDEEWALMRQHPLHAGKWLKPIVFLTPALDIPLYHHERWDGTGYPFGLAGRDIPLAARIFAIVDVWDALRSDRPYRKAWSRNKVIRHLQDQEGKHFDPDVVKAFLEVIEKKPDLDRLESSPGA